MANMFDNLGAKVFSTCSEVFGYDAEWTDPLSETHTARVLFRDPTIQEKVLAAGFELLTPTVEWKLGDLPGLFEQITLGNLQQIVIDGRSYMIRSAEAIHDGRTFRANLEFISS